jgi:hypothetical protein
MLSDVLVNFAFLEHFKMWLCLSWVAGSQHDDTQYNDSQYDDIQNNDTLH